jgi:heme exporter protein D
MVGSKKRKIIMPTESAIDLLLGAHSSPMQKREVVKTKRRRRRRRRRMPWAPSKNQVK